MSDERLREAIQLKQARFKKKEKKHRSKATRRFILKFLHKNFTKRATAKTLYFELLLLTNTTFTLPGTSAYHRIPVPTTPPQKPTSNDGTKQ